MSNNWYQPTIRKWHILRCLDCGHVWDDLNPNHEICACFDKTGRRRSELLTAGATNAPKVLNIEPGDA